MGVFLSLSFLACKKEQAKEDALIAVKSEKKDLIITIPQSEIELELNKISLDSANRLYNFKHKDSLLAFYFERNGKAAWENYSNRLSLLNNLKKAHEEGLRIKDYPIKKIEKLIDLKETDIKTNVLGDLFLTDTYLDYAYHLTNGKLNPNKLYKDWSLTPNSFPINKQLNKALDQKNISQSLENLKPKELIYTQLKRVLPKYKSLINSDSLRTIVKHGDKIKPNTSNDRILAIRKRLNELGFLNDSLVNSSKELDTLLQEGIKAFQASKKLRTDAIIGKGTIDALNETYKDKYYSLIANLERLRWYPRNKGEEYILVNIADYNLTYAAKNDTSQHAVVVGRADRKTPIFSSEVNYLEFNPMWFIPPTIKNEDIIPAARKNSNYITKKSISIFNKEGKKLHPDSINWSSSATSSYRYVQSSGNSNALGRVKIIFPNNFSVYLHDTPSKSLFNKNYRARSSGCVRVQNPFNLSAKLLRKKDGYSRAKIDTILKRRNTLRVYVEHPVKVHFLYWSVTFNSNNQPVFINDVYQLDKNLAKKILD